MIVKMDCVLFFLSSLFQLKEINLFFFFFFYVMWQWYHSLLIQLIVGVLCVATIQWDLAHLQESSDILKVISYSGYIQIYSFSKSDQTVLFHCTRDITRHFDIKYLDLKCENSQAWISSCYVFIKYYWAKMKCFINKFMWNSYRALCCRCVLCSSHIIFLALLPKRSKVSL